MVYKRVHDNIFSWKCVKENNVHTNITCYWFSVEYGQIWTEASEKLC